MPPPDDAHRKSETARLLELFQRSDPGVGIIGISGPGGVGKSYLLNHALDTQDTASIRALKLSVDGSSEQARTDFFGLVDGQLAKPSLSPPAKPKHDYFPQVRRVASIHRALVDAVAAELKASGAPQEIKDAALALLRAGRRLNKAVPRTREYLDLSNPNLKDSDVGQTLDEAWELVTSLRALRSSAVLPGPIRDVLGMTYKERVKNDLYNVTADALVSDLSAAISGYRKQDRFRILTQEPIDGIDRLLLVFDDFEALAPTLEEFLVGALIPRLADAPFPTTIVILGRDDLDAMHPAWGQHCRKYILDQIRLSPFGREDALNLLTRAGVPEERREELYQATQGFPFLLSLLIEEVGAEGADSALFLRKFFDRTTRWMSGREREWFVKVCYLDSVNTDTLGPLFPGEEVEKIQDWFEREASIRDPAASVFRVRPLIREKVLRYLELRSPSKHREMLDQGKKLG
ncbi:hypothetical protein [Polyangium aurulentum]|uniref:hypothetical protein n=1 Tax=Polyangium aurulentum TaxID=2567896 RepID=UPI0010ADC811|nr:hypothetical protein [Polyangium aurulentum]UQA61338.1 hypothetical protein E8A73_013030 [Polyangium aurulentum]